MYLRQYFLISSVHKGVRTTKNLSKMSYHRKVFVSRSDLPENGINVLKKSCEVDIWPSEKGLIPRDEFLRRIVGKNALLIQPSEKIDKEALEVAGSNLKVVSTVTVGIDHIDIEECKKRSVRVGHTPDVVTESTAELTVTLLLATTRRLIEANKALLQNEWKWYPMWLCGKGLIGSTVGIVGFGRIGQSVARKLVPFDVSRILYTGPRQKSEDKQTGAIFTDFDSLLKSSDFVIVTCPLNDHTKGMFTAEKFSLMKSSAIFINTSRGGVVDQDALLNALENKVIRAAGLDVMTPEPLPPDHPLTKLDNCVLVPHIGTQTEEANEEMCMLAVNNILSALDCKEMPAEYKL